MIWEELKKIWRPKVLLIILIVSILAFIPLFAHYFDGDFGEHDGEYLRTYIEMVKRYGTELSDEEYEDVCKWMTELEEEMDAYLAENKTAKEYGIETYQELKAKEWMEDEEKNTEIYIELLLYLRGHEVNRVLERYDALCGVSFSYEMYKEYYRQSVDTKEAYMEEIEKYNPDRFNILWNSLRAEMIYGEEEMWRNIMPSELVDGTSKYFGNVLLLIVIAAALLLSPLLVRDRMQNIRPMQYGSLKGRSVLYTQFAAVLISVLLLTTVYVLVLGGMFLTHGVLTFGNCRLASFMNHEYPWINNMTYSVYLWILILMIYLICIGTAGILFFLSSFNKNYVGMILKVLPVIVLAYFCYPDILTGAFTVGNTYCQKAQIPMMEVILAGVIFVAGTILGIITCVKAKKKEL